MYLNMFIQCKKWSKSCPTVLELEQIDGSIIFSQSNLPPVKAKGVCMLA